jgi:integrase
MLLWIKERDLEMLDGIEAYLKTIPNAPWTTNTKLLRAKMIYSRLSFIKEIYTGNNRLSIDEQSEVTKAINPIQFKVRTTILELTALAEKERERKSTIRVTERQVLKAAKAAKPLNAMLVVLFYYVGVESKEVIKLTWEDALSVIPEAVKNDLFADVADLTGKVFRNMTIQNISQRVRRVGQDVGAQMTPSVLRQMKSK